MLSTELKKLSEASEKCSSQDAQELLIAFNELQFEKSALEAAELSKSFASVNEASEAAPEALLAAYDGLRKASNIGVNTIEACLVFITSRLPSVKAEDNLGVGACLEVLKLLKEQQGLLEGGAEEKGGGGGGGGGRFCNVNAKRSFLSRRGEIEAKILAANKKSSKESSPTTATATKEDSEDGAAAAAGVVAPSTRLLLKQLDADSASDIARSWRVLRRVAQTCANLFVRNFSTLDKPRKNHQNAFIG